MFPAVKARLSRAPAAAPRAIRPARSWGLAVIDPGEGLDPALLVILVIAILTGLALLHAHLEIRVLRRRARPSGATGLDVPALEALVTHAPIGLGVLDRAGRHVYINPYLTALGARPAEAVVGATFGGAVPEVAPPLEAALAQALETRAAVRGVMIEGVPPGSDGGSQSATVDLHPILDERGAVASVAVVVQDVTGRLRDAEAFRRIEGRLQRLWASNILGVMCADADGAVLDANEAMLQILGYSPEDLASGRARWDTVTPSELGARDARGIAEAYERGACTPYEKAYVHADGRRVPVLIGYAILSGASPEFICFALDLSEQKRVESALAAQLSLNKTITDNASSALFLLDAQGRCTFMNPAAEAMTGFSLAEISGATLHEKIHHHRADGQPYPIEECPLARAQLHGLELHAHEDVLIRKSGETFPALCTLSPIVHEGRPAGTVYEARDLTEQARIAREREELLDSERAARAVAEKASRVKDDFVATLSHELRTPLHAIQGWTGLLRRPAAQTPNKIGHGLDVIERNTRQLSDLIADLLDVSRIASGKLHVERAPVDLEQALDTALDGARSSAAAKGVALRAKWGAPGATVLGDETRLVQVISNLLSNAVKFTPQGGWVEVETKVEGGYACVIVSDSGEGIAQEHLPHVFDRFRQADSSSTRQHGGLGLGLAIVKHLVELHGGCVHAESAGLGRGARFVVELPLANRQAPSRREGEDLCATQSLAGVQLLLVEDDDDAREVIQRILEERGAVVRSVASAPEAFGVLDEARPDVLVSDIGLPGTDGYDLMRTLRANEGPLARPLPSVALTAFARPEDRQRALDAGFSLHLSKPLEPRTLVAAVSRLAEEARGDGEEG